MTNINFLNKQITARLVAAVTLVSLLLSALPVAFFEAEATNNAGSPFTETLTEEYKVRVCHATGNGGYTNNEVSVNAIINGTGHGGHSGDIIPPFLYFWGLYQGKNWWNPSVPFDFKNISIWTNDCVDPNTPPPTPKTSNTVVVTSVDTKGFTIEASGGGQSKFVFNASAPLGVGNFKLISNSSNDARAGAKMTVDVPLSTLDGLSYKTKQNAANVSAGNAAYRITFDADGNTETTNDVATLIYEPYWQNGMSPDDAPVLPNVWQTWDVDSGFFWASIPVANRPSLPAIENGAGGPPFYTLAQIEAFYPNAKVTSFGVHIGSYNPLYNIDVDAVVFGTDTEETTYNFEPTPKTVSEVDITGNTSAGENQTGWMFGRDLTTATPFAFNDAAASLGDGSLYVGPITNTNFGGVPANNPNKDKFIAEYFPATLAVNDFDGLKYDFKIGTGGDAADANQFYVNVYTNTADNDDFYDCRYDYAVSAATTGNFNTVSILPTDIPTAVQTRGSSELQPCPTTLAGMPAGSHIRAFAINVGDTSASDAGLDAHLDKVVLDTSSNTTTFDFEPLVVCSLTITSSDVDFVSEKNALAKLLDFVHSGWLPETVAQWIWGDNPVTDSTVQETQTFVKKFNWTGGVPTSATLKVASDNGHVVTLGAFTGSSTVSNSFAVNKEYNVASAIVAGENTLSIAVTNLATPNDSNPQANPAGLMYELVVNGVGENCGSVVPITPVKKASLTITSPVADLDVVTGVHNFTADYIDNDETVDNIQWAIREGSCNAGVGTVAGNVDGFSDASSFVGINFSALVDTTDFEPGEYCFVVNPQEQEGETDLRKTRLFVIEEPPARDVTVCKYDEEQNELEGWQLSLLGDLVDTVSVPTNNMNGANSVALDEEGSYVAIAEGTWTNSGQSGNLVDAEYSTVDNWVTQMDGFTGYSQNILELQINSAFGDDSNWGPYNSLHRYAQGFSPENDGPANFRIFDGNGQTPEAGWYGDNQGTLSVKVYEGFTGVTDDEGCVTFEDVPYDSYQLDEVMQNGWENISGLGTVTVNGEPQQFSVVNRDTTIPLTCELNIKSSLSTVLDTYDYSVATYNEHESWTADIPGAMWIWASEYVPAPLESETHVFTETFTASNTSSALLDVAADNTYKVYVNNVLVLDRDNENNYGSHTQKNDVDIASALIDGENTIRFEVTNLPLAGGNKFTNPAGLLFNLDIVAETDCEKTTEPEPEVPPVDVCLNLEGNQSVIPQGYQKVGDSSDCTLIPETPVDVCPNLEGNQSVIPEGYQKVGESNECTEVPPTVTPQPESRSSSGGTRTGSRNAPSGQVLGASTMQCGMLLDTYMKMGQNNDATEVQELQWFLIGQGYSLTATGVFDAATDAAVKAFQEAYRAEILTPWVTAGILKISNPTGWVYQLTRWKINNIVCPGSEAAPVLIP